MSKTKKAKNTITSVRELQRNYRKYFDLVHTTQQPVFFYRHHQPEAVLISVEMYEQAFKEVAENTQPELRKREESQIDELVGLFGKNPKRENLKKLALKEWENVD